MKILYVSALLLTICLSACSSSEKKDPLLEEAAHFHQQATDVQQQVEPKIEQIDSLRTVILAEKLPNASTKVAILDSLKTAFEQWEENLVEVPGMPHHHSHDHGDHRNGRPAHHHHQDATLNDLPAEQMRDLQRETLNTIRQIQTRLNQVTSAGNP